MRVARDVDDLANGEEERRDLELGDERELLLELDRDRRGAPLRVTPGPPLAD